MAYIPKRIIEDHPDTFSPFVPADPDSKVEICNNYKKNSKKKTIKKPNYLLYFILMMVLYLRLKK